MPGPSLTPLVMVDGIWVKLEYLNPLTLDIGGHPAAATQIYLGSPPANPASGSPLTFTR